MTNIVLLVRDRPRLTEQTLRTLYEETPRDQFNLVIVDDGSWPETAKILERYTARENCEAIHLAKPVGIVGWLRNVGVGASERYFGRGEWLCTIDNDIAFMSGWLDDISSSYDATRDNLRILGGYRHPFHGVNDDRDFVQYTDAVAGYMHFMDWETWDEYGPYDQHAKGVCQSEDFAICQKVIADGFKVGYNHPPVIANCGITNSEGNPAVGSESFPRIPGLIYE